MKKKIPTNRDLVMECKTTSIQTNILQDIQRKISSVT